MIRYEIAKMELPRYADAPYIVIATHPRSNDMGTWSTVHFGRHATKAEAEAYANELAARAT